MARELAELQLDVVNRSLDAWAPIVERLGGGLEGRDAHVCTELRFGKTDFPLGVAVDEKLRELIGDPLLHFVEEGLGVVVHGRCGGEGASLESGVVVMRRAALQVVNLIPDC